MPSLSDWKVPTAAQPRPEDYGYDLEQAFNAVVGLRAIIPSDAYTAETLGTERAGNGVFIRGNGLVLTIGYLITEAETIWLNLADGRSVPGHVLGYDQETGFGLVQALAKLDMPALEIGNSAAAAVGERVVVAGAGGRQRSVAARIVAKQEFAGYWEYVLDEAIFTAPAHRAPAAVAWPLRHRGGEPPSHCRPRRPRTGQARRSAHRRYRAFGRRQGGARSRGLLPPRLGPGPSRRRRADLDLPGRRHAGSEGQVERAQPLPQGSEPALSSVRSPSR